jgi:hypothetical protein
MPRVAPMTGDRGFSCRGPVGVRPRAVPPLCLRRSGSRLLVCVRSAYCGRVSRSGARPAKPAIPQTLRARRMAVCIRQVLEARGRDPIRLRRGNGSFVCVLSASTASCDRGSRDPAREPAKSLIKRTARPGLIAVCISQVLEAEGRLPIRLRRGHCSFVCVLSASTGLSAFRPSPVRVGPGRHLRPRLVRIGLNIGQVKRPTVWVRYGCGIWRRPHQAPCHYSHYSVLSPSSPA